MREAARTALAVALLLLALSPGRGDAHVRSTAGQGKITQGDGASVRYELSLERELLVAAAGGDPDNVGRYVLSRVELRLDGIRCDGTLARAEAEERAGRAYSRLLLGYDCPGSASGEYEVRYGVFSDGDAVVDEHTSVTEYRLGGEAGTFVFDAGHRELDVGEAGRLASEARFASFGAQHILGGLDHLLFLAVLLLGAPGLRSVAQLATAFTAAHSLTLALAALGWVNVPAEVVEPLIALSIADVAVENVVGGESRHRLAVVFGFGLLHGLGFAGALSFTDGFSGPLLASLLSFNVGIELGQALLIAVLFPLLLLVRRARWSGIAHAGAAVVAATVGLAWFFDRLVS